MFLQNGFLSFTVKILLYTGCISKNVVYLSNVCVLYRTILFEYREDGCKINIMILCKSFGGCLLPMN